MAGAIGQSGEHAPLPKPGDIGGVQTRYGHFAPMRGFYDPKIAPFD